MKNLFILLFLFGNLSLSAQTAAHSDSISKAIVRLLAQQLAFPQEKIYLQTDRPYYLAGEKVFFRTFLINAAFLTPAMYSRYVYVELLSPADTVVVRQQIRMDENKMFYGALTLPEALPEGEYRIRSYTRYMENWGDFWFYTRPLFIANPASAKAEKQPPKSRSKNVPEINFYPEGGNLIAGQTNRVAFKALLPGGKPIAVTGSVFDSNDELQATFTTLHEGMGTFNLKVRAGEKYHARYEHNNRQYKLKLPTVSNDAFSLQAVWEKDSLTISVLKPDAAPAQPYYLLIHRQGLPNYFQAWDFAKKEIRLNKEKFATGVTHLLLLAEDFRPVSERMVFNNRNDQAKIEINTHQTVFHPREKVSLTMNLIEELKDTFPASLAIAVTDDKDIRIDTTTNIVAEILLASELKGVIRHPAQYFREEAEALEAADLLMLTHGWRNYHVAEALQGELQQPAIKPEVSQSFSGTLKKPTGKPYKKGRIKMTAEGYDYSELIESDDKGRYLFTDFEFPDSTLYFFLANTDKKKTDIEIHPDEIKYPPVPATVPSEESVHQQTNPDFIAKADKKYLQENGMRQKDLPEVTVKARRKEKKNDLTTTPEQFQNPPDGFLPTTSKAIRPLVLNSCFGGYRASQMYPTKEE